MFRSVSGPAPSRFGLSASSSSTHNKQKANPFCGWCVYSQKCLPKHTCLQDNPKLFQHLISRNERIDQALWLNSAAPSSQCPYITNTSPSRFFNPAVILQKNNNEEDDINFTLNLRTIIDPNVEYFCDVNVNFNEFSAKSLSYSTTLNRVKARLIYAPNSPTADTLFNNLYDG